MRSSAYNRQMTWRKAKRKARLDKELNPGEKLFYNNLHQYSKNKIHCSCPMCRSRTKRRRKQWDWGPGRYNYKISELRRQISMDYDVEDWNSQ